jgi:ketosteroid isomerase-like protein
VSRKNVEVLRCSNEAFNRGDVEAALSYLHPSIEWRDLQHAPDQPEVARGAAAIREVWEGWLDARVGLRAEVVEFIDAGSAVVCVTRWHAQGTASGIEVVGTSAEVYEFEDGLVVRATLGYRSRDQALNAVGFEE